MNNDERVLDEPIWNALSGSQAKYSIGGNTAKRYQRDTVPFASFANLESPDWAALGRLVTIGEQLLIPAIALPDDSGFKAVYIGYVRQYVYRAKMPPRVRGDIFATTLTVTDIPEMLNLAVEAKLGAMMKNALDLGRFIGIRSQGKLVSMAGERINVDKYREISEVCTAPDHVGQGLATFLVSRLVTDIIECGEVPILHVNVDNARAIAVYERIGFEYRKDNGIQFVEYTGEGRQISLV